MFTKKLVRSLKQNKCIIKYHKYTCCKMKIDVEALKKIMFTIKIIWTKLFLEKNTKILNKDIVDSVTLTSVSIIKIFNFFLELF